MDAAKFTVQGLTVTWNSITIQWEIPKQVLETIDNFEVRYKISSPSGNKWLSVWSESNKSHVTITNLQENSSYDIKFRPIIKGEDGPFSEIINCRTKELDKKKTSSIVVDYADEKEIHLRWDAPCLDVKEINFYEVRYKQSDQTKWNSINTDGTANNLKVKNLNANTKYEFKVRAILEEEDGPFSDVLQTFTSNAVHCNTCIKLETEFLGNSIRLQWLPPDVPKDDIDFFEVRYKPVEHVGSWKSARSNMNENYIIFSDVLPNIQYEFKVRAIINGEDCPFSETIRAKLHNADKMAGSLNTSKTDKIDDQKLGKPRAVKVTSSTVSLRWDCILKDANIINFEIKYRKQGDGITKWQSIATDDSKCHHTLTKLEPSTPYEFRVCAIYETNDCKLSETSDTIYTKDLKFCKPTILEATHNSLTVSWQQPDDEEEHVGSYGVLYKEQLSLTENWFKAETESEIPQITLKNLNPFTEYELKIQLINEDGEGPISTAFKGFRTTRPKEELPEFKIPGEPTVVEAGPRKISLRWDPCKLNDLEQYELQYRECSDTKPKLWERVFTSDKIPSFIVNELKCGMEYEFRVASVIDSSTGTFSKTSKKIATPLSLGKRMQLAIELPVDKGPPERYKLPLKVTKKHKRAKTRKCILSHEDLEFQSKRVNTSLLGQACNFFKQVFASDSMPPGYNEKTIMLVGATGSGKSTLIDGMMNYITDVSWEDDFRFSIIDITQDENKSKSDQTKSQTEWITSYHIPQLKDGNLAYVLNIIDTPGFGDTRGIARDKEIVEQVDNLFRNSGPNSIQSIDAVCFVAQSPLARLTPTQKYIFDSILAIFGKDIAKNILVLVTFADGSNPPVIEALKKAEVPFDKYFKFNNSALFEPNTQIAKDNTGRTYWKMGEENFRIFFNHLTTLTPQSLQLTTKVLKNRKVLETNIVGLQRRVLDGMNQMNTMRKEAQILKDFKSEIERNKSFTYTVREAKIVEIKLKVGEYVTNCITCNMTCHYPCGIPDNGKKAHCSAMTDNHCRMCPSKCHWKFHHNATFRLDTELQNVTKTSDELKQKYDIAMGGSKTLTQNIENVKKAFVALQDEVRKTIQEIRRCINELEKIALKPSPLSDIEYIDILIRAEESEAKPGWDDRVQFLKSFRTQAELLQKAASGTLQLFDQAEDVDRFWNNLIK